MKRLVVFLMILILAAPLFGGGQEEKVQEDPNRMIELEFLTNQVGAQPDSEEIERIVEDFNTLNEGKIEVKIVGIPEYSNYMNRLKTNVAAREEMDIFFVMENIQDKNFWAYGYMADISPYMDDEFYSYKDASQWEACKVNDQLWGVPFFSTMVGIFYNKEHFEDAGIEAPLKSWDEFFSACEKLEDAGYTPISLQTMGTAWTSMLMYSAYNASYGGAGYLTGIDSFDEEYFVEGATALKRMYEYTTEDALGGDYPIAANNFLTGNTSMIANGPWMIGEFEGDLKGKVGAMAYPGPNSGQGTVTLDGPFAILGTAKSNEDDPQKMKAIVSFMKYFSQPENIKRIILNTGRYYTGKVEFSSSDEINPVLKDMFDARDDSYIIAPRMRDSVPATFATAMEEELANLWLGKINEEEFVKNLNRKTFR